MKDDAIEKAQKADKLNALFENLDVHDSAAQGEVWASLWNDGRWLPFERGRPNPALEETLSLRGDLLGTSMSYPTLPSDNYTGAASSEGVGIRRTALVPGCGRGLDVFLLASFGYDTTGLEISDTAVLKANEEGDKIYSGERVGMGYEIRDLEIGIGRTKFVKADFFKWGGEDTRFDLIYDYTFLSALPPTLRPAWAASMARLLEPGHGRLICVEFPTEKPLDSGGPPWGLPQEVYLAHLGNPGRQLQYDNNHVEFDENSPTASDGLERIARWQPRRTHTAGSA